MSLIVNLRHLENHSLQLQGELTTEELDIDSRDEVIGAFKPLAYDLEVEKLEGGLLVQGSLRMTLDCQCVRCLTPFQHQLHLPHWTAHVPLQGEDALPVVSDCVDLTAVLREDILLEFPQHPLCKPDCRGLPKGKAKNTSSNDQPASGSSAWAELNKLKF